MVDELNRDHRFGCSDRRARHIRLVGKPQSTRHAALVCVQEPIIYRRESGDHTDSVCCRWNAVLPESYYQTIRGYDTLRAGLAGLPQALTFFIASQQAVRINKRFSARQAIAFGIGLASIGMLAMALTFHTDTPYWLTAIGQILLSLGIESRSALRLTSS